jgi:Fe-S cluster assembly ATPase SufC
MGPNGSGKSTLSKVLAGHPSYDVISGEFCTKARTFSNWSRMSAHARASLWRSVSGRGAGRFELAIFAAGV